MNLTQRRITRREFVRLAAAAAAGTGLTALIGCQPSPPTPSPTAAKPVASAVPATITAPAASPVPTTAATPVPTAAATTAPSVVPTAAAAIKRGGSLRVVVQTDFQTMWPMLSSNASPWDCFDSLFRWRQDEKGNWGVKPGLVESWDLEPTRAVFRIRRGVKFHDGSDLDAEVVRWNIEQMRNHPQSALKTDLGVVDTKNPAQVLDKYTVQVNLTAPSATLPVMLADFEYQPRIVSKAAWEKLGESGLAKQAVGTGPFKLVKWESGNQLVVRRFEDYWENGADNKPLPYVDEIVYRYIPSDATRLVEVRTGNADFSDFVPAKDIPAVKADPNLVYLQNQYVASLYFFFFNSERPPFGNNLKLRQAAQYAIDREAVAKAIGMGLGSPGKYHFTPGTPGYDTSVPYYWYNPDKAKQLVKDAGYPNGVDATLSIVARDIDQQQAEMMKQMLDAVGIKVTIEAMEQLAWTNKVLKGRDFQMATRRNILQPDPDRVLTMDWGGSPGARSTYFGGEIPELNQLAVEGRGTYDPQKRHQIYVRAQTIMYDSAWWGYLWMTPRNYVFNKRVRNFPTDVWATFMRERELWLDS